MSKDIYNKILEQRMDEILDMSKKIDYHNLVYNFKGLTFSINFTTFGGPMYTYNQFKNGEKNYNKYRKSTKIFKKIK